MAVRITEAEILEAIAAAVSGTAPADARTTEELCAEFHVGEKRMRRYLKLMARAGRLVVHPVCRRNWDGRMMASRAYTVLPAKAASKKR